MVAFGLFLVILGAGQWVNGAGWGAYVAAGRPGDLAVVLFQWFSQAIRESEGGLYSDRIDVSYRWSMSWFIFSEVMFFAAFFGALYWARVHAVPMLGNLDHQILWPDFKAIWPSAGGRHHGLARRHGRALPDHGPVAAAHHQYRAAADLGRHADHRPPRADRRPARQDHRLDVDHGDPGRHLRGRAGLRVHPRLQRPEPQAQLGHLRLDLLHAHRLPRLPRARRHADAAVHHAAPA